MTTSVTGVDGTRPSAVTRSFMGAIAGNKAYLSSKSVSFGRRRLGRLPREESNVAGFLATISPIKERKLPLFAREVPHGIFVARAIP